MIKVVFHTYKELLIKERIRSIWEQILSFKRSSHLKMDAIEENHCLIQLSPFVVRNFFSVLATSLKPNGLLGLTLCHLVCSADNLCKKYGPMLEPTKAGA